MPALEANALNIVASFHPSSLPVLLRLCLHSRYIRFTGGEPEQTNAFSSQHGPSNYDAYILSEMVQCRYAPKSGIHNYPIGMNILTDGTKC